MMSLRERAQRGLQNTDVGFHATEEKRVASIEIGHTRTELAIAEAAELQLVQRSDIRQQGSYLRNCLSESSGVLCGDDHRERKNFCRANQELAVAHQTFLFVNRRQQFFLDIDDQQCTLLRIENLTGDFCRT